MHPALLFFLAFSLNASEFVYSLKLGESFDSIRGKLDLNWSTTDQLGWTIVNTDNIPGGSRYISSTDLIFYKEEFVGVIFLINPRISDFDSYEDRNKFISDISEDYKEVKRKFENRRQVKKFISLEEARNNKFQIDWKNEKIIKPNFIGSKVIKLDDLSILVNYIDWTQFFLSWNLYGVYPKIFDSKVNGEEAKKLFNDANKMIEKIIKNNLINAKAVFGIYEANSIKDDIEVYDKKKNETFKFITLRQQKEKEEKFYNNALSDFIAPKETGIKDYIGCFCVSAGFGSDELSRKYEEDNDDYSSIMIKAICDRFAEAFAEYLHKEVRINYWGYAKDETTTNDDLIKERYVGIRPAPGYPACPDHLEKKTIWKLLSVEKQIGVKLTESLAMWPAASVSGYYFGNSNAKYFGIGKIDKDQMIDYAKRRNISFKKAVKWLNPIYNDV